MKQMNHASHHPALQQLHKNACSWVGHWGAGAVDFLAGQTFQCPENGELESIDVFVADVPLPGKLVLTLHQFNNENKTWGPVISTSEIDVESKNREHWMQFSLQPVQVQKNITYGFRLNSPDGLVAVGEAVWTHKNAFAYGVEWKKKNTDQRDFFFCYFSLAFKAALRA
jgi:hypothetical protein